MICWGQVPKGDFPISGGAEVSDHVNISDNITIRRAGPEDTPAFRALWELCFDDSPAFADFFFRERFAPELGVCAAAEGQAVGSVHGWPFVLRLRGRPVPCRMYSGVCVHPDYRGRGLMRRMMALAMRDAARQGIPLLPLRPVDFAYYTGLGFFPCGRTVLTSFSPAPPSGAADIRPLDPAAALPALHACYTEAAARYANIILRDEADMARKCAEHAADGGRFLGLYRAERLRGYCAYFPGEEEALAEETVACRPEDLSVLCAAAASRCGTVLRAKLPPDAGMVPPRPYHAMAAGNAGALLAALGPDILGEDFRAELRDPAIPENNGVWDARGRKIGGEAPLSLPAGRLAQWLSGYCALEDLAGEPEVEIRDAAAAHTLSERLPPLVCYMADEY